MCSPKYFLLVRCWLSPFELYHYTLATTLLLTLICHSDGPTDLAQLAWLGKPPILHTYVSVKGMPYISALTHTHTHTPVWRWYANVCRLLIYSRRPRVALALDSHKLASGRFHPVRSHVIYVERRKLRRRRRLPRLLRFALRWLSPLM